MKKTTLLLAAVALCSSLLIANAQMGGRGPSGPDFSGAMSKLFGDNPAFSATTEVQIKNNPATGDMTLPGKISYLDGKSRFEMDMTELKSAQMSPEALGQMKQMGMDKMVAISVPETKKVLMIYPNLKAYAEMPGQNPDAGKSAEDFDVKITELGKETVGGHECVKNKVIVTDKEGKTHEYTVWNATDLKKFPVKIETSENNMDVVMNFKDVKFSKPDSSVFEPPSDYTKYDSFMALMHKEVMKKMGGGTNMPR